VSLRAPAASGGEETPTREPDGRETTRTIRAPEGGQAGTGSMPGTRTAAEGPGAGPPESTWGPLRLLLVEDSRAYASLVEHMLRDALGVGVRVTHRDTLAGARLALLEERIDCVLLDLSLPDAGGLEALEVVQSTAPYVPIVVLTGTDDEELATRAVHDGAQDFLVKRLAEREVLARSVRYAIERKRAELRLAYQALHDSLTDLPNRTLLLDRVTLALARCHRRSHALALMFVDLDRFKTVNDSLGHDAGDELLIELAGRLRRIVRPSDTVARFGGDEFLILCEELHSEREALFVAERVRAALAEPVRVRGRAISIRASVGIACGAPGMSAEGLIREADVAMYRAKRTRTGIELFRAAMHAEALSALETEQELRGALERRELRLHFQPVISIGARQRPLAVEALLRWHHRRRGLLLPSDFIGLAEETGLIVPIGEWALIEACRQLAGWQRRHAVPRELVVSVNLSLCQLGSPGFVDSVAAALAASALAPRSLCMEVTESSVAQDPVGAAAALDGLKGLGVSLALDDFGTGYSSLSALTSYPVDMVKIDRAFLAQLDGEGGSARMFEAVLGVVRAAELQAVAEGVESEAQLELLRAVGCDAAQGYLFARPAPASDALAKLVSLEAA
jgi:diguanylate cyclase (GGDEF)-like protein